MLTWLYWNPDPTAFVLPFVGHPVRWYGIFFALGFVAGYLLMRKAAVAFVDGDKRCAALLVDKMMWYIVIGVVVGARLGHVFFYDWKTRFAHNLLDVVKVWEGGLASHGGVVGAVVGFALFRLSVRKKFPHIKLLTLLDAACLPSALVSFAIRIGNFFNQEIVGGVTTLPWAVIFGNSPEGVAPLPRHPVQLYEAISYLALFCLFFPLWAKRKAAWLARPGAFTGLYIALMFAARFALEFVKLPQSEFDGSLGPLMMGQLLSLPF
ncbi:prolipoprotein diacylglyceryl transferase, partial [Simkania negevensis]|nr:prolipoprotein diacylglyceryl transferase [Simkania negevensis]